MSLLTSHSSLVSERASVPGVAGEVRASAGVAQLVEHLFCKQVVSGSIPLASSTAPRETISTLSSSKAQHTQTSEGCPSGQREQAVNLPAHAYVGSNPTPSTILNRSRTARGTQPGMSRSRRGFATAYKVSGPRPQSSRRRAAANFAGVAQLVESQFSKLIVEGSSPFSRSTSSGARCTGFDTTLASRLLKAQKQTRPASLVAGEVEARTGAERTSVREHRTAAETQPPAKIAGRRYSRNNVTRTNLAHLAQLVEHVLGKDEVTSSSLVVGSNLQP